MTLTLTINRTLNIVWYSVNINTVNVKDTKSQIQYLLPASPFWPLMPMEPIGPGGPGGPGRPSSIGPANKE